MSTFFLLPDQSVWEKARIRIVLGRLDGAPAGAADTDGGLAIAVPIGPHRIAIRP